jgi:hypothetical protein
LQGALARKLGRAHCNSAISVDCRILRGDPVYAQFLREEGGGMLPAIEEEPKTNLQIFMLNLRCLAFVSTAAILFPSCKSTNESVEAVSTVGDTTFARETVGSLARGDTAVKHQIDWETLNSLGVNVGASYSAIASETEREEFKNAFITQFAASFRDSGGTIENFSNWRVSGQSDNRTEVSADSSNGVLRVTVSRRNDLERVSKLEMIR